MANIKKSEAIKLILIKHKKDEEGLFKEADGNFKKYNGIWQNIAKEINEETKQEKFNGNMVRLKYNQL